MGRRASRGVESNRIEWIIRMNDHDSFAFDPSYSFFLSSISIIFFFFSFQRGRNSFDLAEIRFFFFFFLRPLVGGSTEKSQEGESVGSELHLRTTGRNCRGGPVPIYISEAQTIGIGKVRLFYGLGFRPSLQNGQKKKNETSNQRAPKRFRGHCWSCIVSLWKHPTEKKKKNLYRRQRNETSHHQVRP